MRAKDLVIPDEEELEEIENAHDFVNCVLCQLGPKPLSVRVEEE